MAFRADSWPRVRDVFESALAQPADRRGAFLAGACGDDAELRKQVEQLLAGHGQAVDFLETSPAASAASLLDDEPPLTFTGRTVGPFRLGESIGSGGMGVVYRAERVDGGFEQHVAIKIIDIAVHDAEALSRFRVERQVLASLKHPHIVQFLDGGLTEDGHAFLVMELVEGVRITQFCRDRRLPLEARLQLVDRICDAVQFAHQHRVLHCDLKPANILVTADGFVKVLDFGVARLIAAGADPDPDAIDRPRPLTPDYASPEQLRGLPVTIASDIYALGVLLYEIVAGRKPFERARPGAAPNAGPLSDPEPPSRALAGLPAAVAEAPPYGGRLLRGDLDAIILKALHPDPAGRYASAQELAGDLGRYRAFEPVTARGASLGYLLGRTARRHRAAAAAAAVALAAVLAALGVSLWQMQRTAAARDRAEARFQDTRQIANALIFKVHDGIEELPGSTPVRQMIVAEALTYLERLSRDPSVDDALRMEMAAAYLRIGDVQGNPGRPNLGDEAGSRASYERAIALLRPIVSGPSPSRQAMMQLARSELRLGEMPGESPAAIERTRAAIAMVERLLIDSPDDTPARNLLANALFDMGTLAPPDEKLAHWQRAAGVYQALLAEKPDDAIRLRNVALIEKHLGADYDRRNDFTAALEHYSRAREIDERLLAAMPDNRSAIFDVAIDLGNVATVAWNLKRFDEAEAGLQRSLAMRERLAALDPRDVQAQGRVAFMHARLGYLYEEMARAKDAREHARKAVAIAEKPAASDPGELAEYLGLLGRAERAAGDRAAGCRAFRRSSAMVDQARAAASAPALDELRTTLTDELARCPQAPPSSGG